MLMLLLLLLKRIDGSTVSIGPAKTDWELDGGRRRAVLIWSRRDRTATGEEW